MHNGWRLTHRAVSPKLCSSVFYARLLNCMRKGIGEERVSAAPLSLGLGNHDLHLVVRHLQAAER